MSTRTTECGYCGLVHPSAEPDLTTREGIRAHLMDAGFKLSEVREALDAAAQDETEGTPEEREDITGQLNAMDDLLDILDSLIGDYTDEPTQEEIDAAEVATPYPGTATHPKA